MVLIIKMLFFNYIHGVSKENIICFVYFINVILYTMLGKISYHIG